MVIAAFFSFVEVNHIHFIQEEPDFIWTLCPYERS